jgi:hypothetical protein
MRPTTGKSKGAYGIGCWISEVLNRPVTRRPATGGQAIKFGGAARK